MAVATNQVVTGSAANEPLILTTTAAIAAIGNAINTQGKYTGKVVFDTTAGVGVVSSGAAAASVWYATDGSGTRTPV